MEIHHAYFKQPAREAYESIPGAKSHPNSSYRVGEIYIKTDKGAIFKVGRWGSLGVFYDFQAADGIPEVTTPEDEWAARCTGVDVKPVSRDELEARLDSLAGKEFHPRLEGRKLFREIRSVLETAGIHYSTEEDLIELD
ncbi:MAG: hypothetical protein KJ709_06090 [Nanoarchaeota archaeon]|nr:hypothetical protein [Nanoarchaeota archaeon]